jgi:DNA repair photolyase
VEAGLPVGLVVAPVIPGLNDRDIPALLRQAAEAGAVTADYTPVRLPGSVKDVFLNRLRAELPDAARRVEQRILELRGGKWNDPRFGWRMHASGAYWESIGRLFETVATRCGLDGGQAWRQGACGVPPAQPRSQRQLPLF